MQINLILQASDSGNIPPIFWLAFLFLIVLLLIIFKDNKWIKPIASTLNAFVLVVISILIGGVLGFFVGYLMYGQILGVSIPLDTILSNIFNNSSFANILLGSIKQKIIISTILGAVLGLIVLIIAESVGSKSKKNNKSSISTSDEILKLNSLKEKGIISVQEFDEQKKKLLNGN